MRSIVYSNKIISLPYREVDKDEKIKIVILREKYYFLGSSNICNIDLSIILRIRKRINLLISNIFKIINNMVLTT